MAAAFQQNPGRTGVDGEPLGVALPRAAYAAQSRGSRRLARPPYALTAAALHAGDVAESSSARLDSPTAAVSTAFRYSLDLACSADGTGSGRRVLDWRRSPGSGNGQDPPSLRPVQPDGA